MSVPFKVEESTAVEISEQKHSKEERKVFVADLLKAGLDDFDTKHGIIDSATPGETLLSGSYKRSFAYHTFRNRLPKTLKLLLTSLRGNLTEAVTYEENDLVAVLNSLAVLKLELENNATLETFPGNDPDNGIWNEFLSHIPLNERTYFKTCWLYSECYLYRKLFSIFSVSRSLQSYDYFGPQKINGLVVSSVVMDQIIRNINLTNNDEKTFKEILKLNLWGNRCDLSISSGKEVKPQEAIFGSIESLNPNILVDQSSNVWHCLSQALKMQDQNSKFIDVVCDNAGFELFTDLLLALFLIENKFADTVRFHVKAFPWFVSDTTVQDIECSLKYLTTHKSENLMDFGKQCSEHFKKGTFQIVEKEYFWTSPYEFYRMEDIKPDLYQMLKKSTLIIFKGDLNYRKLLGDFNWDYTECFEKCLRGFKPSSICSLRTVKGDLICGLKPGLAERLSCQNPDWMFDGEYGVIQFCEH